MKKIKIAALVLALLLCTFMLFACGNNKDDAVMSTEGLEYTLINDDTAYEVSGIGTATDTDIVIPDVYNGLPVTSIGDGAFYMCEFLSDITIPDSVTSIGVGALCGCTSLMRVTIPDSVTSIGEGAFSHCTSLTNVTIPDSVTSIGKEVFNFCSSLEDVYITDIAAWYNIIFDGRFANRYNLYLNGELVTNIVIPDVVTSVADYAFSGCTSLTSVTIGNSVRSIGDYAFSGCASLMSATILDGVTYIGYFAFWNCDSLTRITIPDSVTSISYGVLIDCSSLTSITFTGTKSEWKAISKDYGWDVNTPDYTVTCTDGPIAKDGTET